MGKIKMREEIIANFLNALSGEMPRLDAVRAGGELFAALRFRIFDLFAPGENTLSNILRELLDPRGTHGQGVVFLAKFLEKIGFPQQTREALAGAKVVRECPTHERRRIDLVIDAPCFLIGIENKPWARLLPDQLEDYYNDLANRVNERPMKLVFLSGQDPNFAREHFVRMPFVADHDCSLDSALRAALPEIHAPRVKTFVEEFLGFIKFGLGNEARGVSEEMAPYVDAVRNRFQNPQDRRAIAAVLLSRKEIHKEIVNEIGAFLQQTVQRQQPGINIEIQMLPAEPGQQNPDSLCGALRIKNAWWGLRAPHWPENCFLYLSSESGNFKTIEFGVFAPDGEARPDGGAPEVPHDFACPLRGQLENFAQGFAYEGCGQTVWQPWYKYAQPTDWTENTLFEMIMNTPDGNVGSCPGIQEIARIFVALFNKVNDILNPPPAA